MVDLKENYHVIGVKAEFEAEGTRMEEALRLKEVITKAGLDLTIKIGGCEAIKDLYDARSIGVTRIVAPMIESAYALKKFLEAAKLVFTKEELEEVSLLVNIETLTGYNAFDEMLKLPEIGELDGVVLGRSDMSCSMGLTRDDINSKALFDIAKELLPKSKKHGKETVVGGGVSAESLPFFRNLPEGCLDKYETRKVLFSCPEAIRPDAHEGILKAVGFEMMWLKNKRDFYGLIHNEDLARIKNLEKRYEKSIKDVGGTIG